MRHAKTPLAPEERGKLYHVLVSSRPAPALRDLIRYYYQVDTHVADRTTMQPVPARSPQAIEFTFGAPYEVRRVDSGVTRNAYPIALIGAQTFRRVELIMHGRIDAFTIVFQPAGLFRFFSIPADELTDNDFDGEAVLGRRFAELAHRLGDVSSFGDRVRVANDYLCRRYSGNRSAVSTAHTASNVLQSSGCVRVAALAQDAGLSIRQFERRFRQEIGIAPKLYARIVRFEAALRRRAADPRMPWTDIAHDLGYHDQMHMVHDFNRLSGDSPTAISGQLDMFVHPELRSAGENGDPQQQNHFRFPTR